MFEDSIIKGYEYQITAMDGTVHILPTLSNDTKEVIEFWNNLTYKKPIKEMKIIREYNYPEF